MNSILLIHGCYVLHNFFSFLPLSHFHKWKRKHQPTNVRLNARVRLTNENLLKFVVSSFSNTMRTLMFTGKPQWAQNNVRTKCVRLKIGAQHGNEKWLDSKNRFIFIIRWKFKVVSDNHLSLWTNWSLLAMKWNNELGLFISLNQIDWFLIHTTTYVLLKIR